MNSIQWIALFVILSCKTIAQDFRPTKYVNPFIGTANEGNTNPGPVLPWGMLSLSPFNSYDTVTKRAGASPYYYDRKYISGFTHLNMSGVGCGDMGTFCLMPTTGELTLRQSANTSTYSHETSEPGYYAVQLDRFKIKAELTTSTRTGVSRYTFPKGKSNILLNLGLGLTGSKGAVIKKVSETEIEGFKTIGEFCGITNRQVVFFVAKLSKRPDSSGVWSSNKRYYNFEREIAGDDIGAFFSFETGENEQIEVKLAVSFVSISNARMNLESEQPGFDFDATRLSAGKKWDQQLSKIIVEGGTKEDKIKFYTALYHTLIHPGIANDVNGEGPSMESGKASRANGFNRYTIFSLWDTYRNTHPFLSLVYPKQQSDMVKSMLAMYNENGWLPKWELAGMETGCMVGDPAIPVIADSYLRGIKDFDIDLAWQAMKHNADASDRQNYARPGLDDWIRYGYIPDDASYTLKVFTSEGNVPGAYEESRRLGTVWGSVSTALEYCIADWNIAQMAKALGKHDEYQTYLKRSLNYKNNFDTGSGLVRPRKTDGSWLSPFDPASKRVNGFTEGSSWTYTFMVPHDVQGLMKLMGGQKQFIRKLDTCFEKRYFDVTNEPDLAYPYLYNYVKGQEWKTQKEVRKIVNRDFRNSPGGLPGNDDCGTMSAWLIYSMMGFYPDCPGNMDYQLASPVFNRITIALDTVYYPGKKFVIENKNAGQNNHLVRSMTLNGKQHRKFSINHLDIVNGGKFEFDLKKDDSRSDFQQDYKFPLKVSTNHRYLVDQKNKPFFYNGDTGWMLYMNLDSAEVIDYLSDRKSKNFTAIQTILTGFAGKKNVFNQAPFTDPNDFSTVNEKYFDHVEWVVQQADSLGLLISIAPLWAGCCGEGYGGKGAVGPKSYMNTNGKERSRAFGEYIGKRFKEYSHILWIIGGDIDPYEDRETMDALARGIKSQAPHQLITYHASSSHSSTDVWPETDWLDVVMTYTYFRGFNKAWTQDMPDVYEINYKEYAKTPVKPFFLGESTYEAEHDAWGSAVQARKQAYWSVLTGGFGNAYGTPMWNFPKNWKPLLELPGGNSLQHYYNLFHAFPFYRMLPDPESKIIVDGAGEYAKNNYAVAASDENKKFIIAYIPSGREFKINTAQITAKNVVASWYDPRTGNMDKIGEYKSPGILSLESPDKNDWVLIISDR